MANHFSSSAFLHETVALELAERIATINRSFQTFVCHGASSLSQDVATASISTDTLSYPVKLPAIVFDEGELPFADAVLNAFTSVLTLHAINDVPGALAQIRRALAPDGLFIGAMLGGNTLHELRDCLAAAEIEVDGGVSPRVFPFVDVKDAGGLLQRAGFALPVADSDTLTVHYADPFRLLRDLRNMGETNILNERRRSPLKKSILLRALMLYRDRFAAANGSVPATFEIIYLSGWAPHESQQKPLKPGSARMSLSDALKGPR